MASCSISSLQKSYQYDVFLSFSGEDTRRTFVGHLYAALQQHGIHTFKDDERLKKGKMISDELLKSIEDSKFHIIVFSKNYASSSWCLNELVKIMECQKMYAQTAYPIFFDVDPSEVRKQHGPVGEALSVHKNESEIRKWRKALKEAANLSGWDLRQTADGYEAKVIQLVVEHISLELRSINVDVDEYLIGMEERMQDLELYLKLGLNDVRMIGMKGMGGAGKTTLARAVFDRLATQFEAKSFIENVREVSKASLSCLLNLQKEVYSDLLKDDHGNNISSVYEGKKMLKTKLCHRKVLVVLDDVDHIDQLVALAGEPNWFGAGSRIIITTRDEQVLIANRVKLICDVSLLSNKEALCLFSRHAFGRDVPIKRYKKLSLQVVHYANGLPLTVKVLGSFLCGKDKAEWIDALERLKTIPLQETLKKLELSYVSLEDDYKEIFLDVACLFKGHPRYYVIRILESCGFHARNGLRVLKQKSLLTFPEDRDTGILQMHDHIEEMGKNIVRRLHPDNPNTHSRLWIKGEIIDVLTNDLVNDATSSILMSGMELSSQPFKKGFGKMRNLRCLNILCGISDHENIYPVGQYFPNALRFLHWESYASCFLPRAFQANNLVTLEMPCSKVEQLWEGGERKVLKNLRFVDLGKSKLKFLDLELTPNLVSLKLNGCEELIRLHAPIRCLRKLVYLDLSWCECLELEYLPFIKHLKSLQALNLRGLHLREFPDIIPRHLDSRLRELDFSFNYIEELPSSIGNFKKLVSLYLHACSRLDTLPESICSLPRLRHLYLQSCNIEELPNDLNYLECLETLHLSYTRIKHLPDSICVMKRLISLLLVHCIFLERLPNDLGGLESLEQLDLEDCKIRDIPDSICKLKHLKKLNLLNCDKLENLPEELGYLNCLKELNIEGTSITDLPRGITLVNGRIKIIGFISKDTSLSASASSNTGNDTHSQNGTALPSSKNDVKNHRVREEPMHKVQLQKRSRSV